MPWQHTLQHKLVMAGIGLHSGCAVQCELLPQPADTGIVFVRTDVPGQPQIAAHVAQLAGTTLATSLGVQHDNKLVQVGTVEHLLCALQSLGVDNARVLIDGPEVPVLDGSALLWAQMIAETGLEQQHAPRQYLRVRKEVRVQAGRKWATLTPHMGLRVVSTLDFDHPLIPQTPYRYDASPARFVADIAPARTFCFRQEIDALMAAGLAQGGSLDNAIVIDGYKVLNPEGLRFVDECLRHKVLDALGDLSLLGAPLLGTLESHCSGHALNTDLVRAALAEPGALERITFTELPASATRAFAPASHGLDGLTALAGHFKGLVS